MTFVFSFQIPQMFEISSQHTIISMISYEYKGYIKIYEHKNVIFYKLFVKILCIWFLWTQIKHEDDSHNAVPNKQISNWQCISYHILGNFTAVAPPDAAAIPHQYPLPVANNVDMVTSISFAVRQGAAEGSKSTVIWKLHWRTMTWMMMLLTC